MNVATESIYNLIPKPQKNIAKKESYRSKYDPKAPLTGSTFGLHGTTVTVGQGINELKKTCVVSSTFGPTPKKPDPSQFLRKSSKITNSVVKPSKKFKRSSTSQKPPVPASNDRPIMGLQTCKNFIVSNATHAIIQEPKCVKKEENLYLRKQGYGKVPGYLNKVKSEIQREIGIIEQSVKEQVVESTDSIEADYEVMDEAVRREMICSLKMKWDEVNCTYQKICHRVSMTSLGDIKRKEAQETELKQLEQDIERLSRPGPLYIKKG